MDDGFFIWTARPPIALTDLSFCCAQTVNCLCCNAHGHGYIYSHQAIQSVAILVQAVCKCYQQTTLGGKELNKQAPLIPEKRKIEMFQKYPNDLNRIYISLPTELL